MIEIEKKFILTEEQERNLIQGAIFVSEKTFTDTYYDTPDYVITAKDTWFRKRDDRFELKIPMNVSIEERVSDQYRELENEEDIALYLKLPIDKPFLEALKEANLNPFVSIITTRRKYTKDGFGIDLDSVDFGYSIAEIESMTDDESKIDETTDKIIKYAKTYGLSEGTVYGKVIEYLRRNNPAHFQALIDAKVVKLK